MQKSSCVKQHAHENGLRKFKPPVVLTWRWYFFERAGTTLMHSHRLGCIVVSARRCVEAALDALHVKGGAPFTPA